MRSNFFVSLSTVSWRDHLQLLEQSQNSMELLLSFLKNSLDYNWMNLIQVQWQVKDSLGSVDGIYDVKDTFYIEKTDSLIYTAS